MKERIKVIVNDYSVPYNWLACAVAYMLSTLREREEISAIQTLMFLNSIPVERGLFSSGSGFGGL